MQRMDGLLTTAEVAERWGCTHQWVQALCKRGKLKAALMGKTYVIRERDVDNYAHRAPGRPGKNGTQKPKAAKRGRKNRSRGLAKT